MQFVKAYGRVKSSVVAIVQKFQRGKPEFPEIIGSGFLASRLGLVCTCRHVVDAIGTLYKPEGFNGIPACVLLFLDIEHEGQKGVGVVNLDISGIGMATLLGDSKKYLGPNPPEVSFIMLPVTETPSIEFATDGLEEGEEVAFAGFPMGTRTLLAPGWLHQVTPTLHHGMISAVLPHHSTELPHAFLLHGNTQPGASGSPVFREDGKVVGMVYTVLRHFERIGRQEEGAYLQYPVPTSLTGCVPFQVISQVLHLAEGEIPGKPRQTLLQHLKSLEMKESGPELFEEWRGL